MDSSNLNISLSFSQLEELVKQLSPVDKLKLNELLWKDNMIIPQEHQIEVLDRIEESELDSNRLLNWENVSDQF